MRLFLAVELPATVQAALSRLASELGARLHGWRFVRPGSVHLTLRFLGEVPDDTDAASRRAWRAAAGAGRAARLAVGGLGTFPPGSRPRVLWVGVREVGGGGALAELAAGLESAARQAGFEPEPRPFRPHLTLARAARGARPQPPDADEAVLAEFDAGEVVLFRSRLLRDGARYTPLERFPLGRGDATR